MDNNTDDYIEIDNFNEETANIEGKYFNTGTSLQISGISVPYEQFIEDMATKVAMRMIQIEKGKMEISKSKAYKMFGRADVDRWVRSGMLQPCRVSPGKIRFKLIDLQRIAATQQNYIIQPQ